MIVYILIIAGFLMRLLPHAPNFVPVAAIAVFAGAYLNKRMAMWVPLAIMMVSDLIIGMHDVVLYTWGAFAIIGILSTWLKNRATVGNVFISTVVSAILFFVVTNFGVWLAWYAHTWVGFTTCYINAIPFLRSSILGNVVYAAALFGSYELAKRVIEKKNLAHVLLVD